MTYLKFIASSVMLIQAACSGGNGTLAINESSFSIPVKMDRSGYSFEKYIKNKDGQNKFLLSCYSLDDESRESFSIKSGSDPVADLSCYLKDIGSNNEYTILGLPGEGLQFSPAFFWSKDLARCGSGSYNLRATLRGLTVIFQFSNFNSNNKSAIMTINIENSPSATNLHLNDSAYLIFCK